MLVRHAVRNSGPCGHGLLIGLAMALVVIMAAVAWATAHLIAPPIGISPVTTAVPAADNTNAEESVLLLGAVGALLVSYLALVPGRGYLRSLRCRLHAVGKDHWIRRWRICATAQVVRVGRILAPLTYVAIAMMAPGAAVVAAIVFAAVWLLRRRPAAILNTHDLWSKGATWEEARRATRMGVHAPMVRNREELLAAMENHYYVQRQLALHDQVLL